MSKISHAFQAGPAFIPFITGGYPDIATTERLLYALVEAGADMIEIGIPFSDPIAEGPVIQEASEQALQASCTVDGLFDLVSRVRADGVSTPILFMTYYNPVFVYGNERFAQRCAASGIDGLIVPDLPFEERDELLDPCREHDIELISLIAPTSQTRIERIAKESSGFLYCVSSLGVTGTRTTIDDSARHMIEQARTASDIPCAVGFGISTPQQARDMAQFADGVIVGSAIVRIIAEHGRDCVEPVRQFAREIMEVLEK